MRSTFLIFSSMEWKGHISANFYTNEITSPPPSKQVCIRERFNKYKNTVVHFKISKMAESVKPTSPSIHQDAIKLSTFPEFTAYQLKPCSYFIDVKLTAPPSSQKEDVRAEIDLVAVIDRSGSMIGEKLELVKKVLHFVVLHLKSFDRLGIIIYDNLVEEIASLTKVTQTNRIKLDGRIDKIYGNGTTNLSGGLFKGMLAMKERTGEQAEVASVLLFTDGMANSGITDTKGIITAMKNIYGETKNFTVNTFGFGSGHNVEMLQEISKTGNGLYYFIQSTEQIPEIFSNCLGGLLSTVAQNISVCIETYKDALVKEMLSKAKPTLSDGSKKGKVSMGDLQSEEEHDILVELSLPKKKKSSIRSTSSPEVYAKITLSYFNVIKKNIDSAQIEVSVTRCSDPGEQPPSLEVDEQRNRIKAIESLAKAAEMAEKGRLEEARNIIMYSQQKLDISPSSGSNRTSSLNADLSSAMKGLSDENAFRKYGKSTFATLEDCHSSQRSTSLESPSYITPIRSTTYQGYINSQDEIDYGSALPVQTAPEIIQPIPRLDSKPEAPEGRYLTRSLEHNEEPSSPPAIPTRSKRRSQSLKFKSKPPDSSKGPPFISEL